MHPTPHSRPILLALSLIASAGCSPGSGPGPGGPGGDPPAVVQGERLFLETRFAEFFASHSGGPINVDLANGDPTMDFTETMAVPLPGPFAGKSMNCRACHLVDEHDGETGGGVRTYADFARRSPVPDRPDGITHTQRNSPPLVESGARTGNANLMHFDAQYASTADLVVATLTGRNFGWLPSEHDQAVAHIARVIREDDGGDDLAAEFGRLPYRRVFQPDGGHVPLFLTLPEEFRIDVQTASDEEVVRAVARLIGVYVDNLLLSRDESGAFVGSPYGLFLARNGLPAQPDTGESDLAYSRRLRDLILGLASPVFVEPTDGTFAHHDHPFQFQASELQGLVSFTEDELTGSAGNCIACHPAPGFTDHLFHNVGIAQEEYDSIHGPDTFAALFVPDLAQRDLAPDLYLPPSVSHPNAFGPFKAIPDAGDPSLTDLGLWNVFANPDEPSPQDALRQLLVGSVGSRTDDQILALTIGMFRTASLRDLGQGGPYMHNGRFDTLTDVIEHYFEFSEMARQGDVRNADPKLSGIVLSGGEFGAIADFLRALDEDYD